MSSSYEEIYPNMSNPEKVLCAAIWYKDGKKHPHQPVNIKSGFVICGLRHNNCISALTIFGKRVADYKETIQGFITTKNRFLDRREAAVLAKEMKQADIYTGDILFSENLY